MLVTMRKLHNVYVDVDVYGFPVAHALKTPGEPITSKKIVKVCPWLSSSSVVQTLKIMSSLNFSVSLGSHLQNVGKASKNYAFVRFSGLEDMGKFRFQSYKPDHL